MSQAEREVMQAGPELDARIARLMGRVIDETRCPVCGWPLRRDVSLGCVPGNCAMRPGPVVRYDAIPRYSTDIAAAFTVVEKFTAQGHDVVIRPNGMAYDGVPHVEIGLCDDGSYSSDREYCADAPTTPHAICLAALAALENAHV